jgi:DNA invertase Pin-like site-specific DNA recombinase
MILSSELLTIAIEGKILMKKVGIYARVSTNDQNLDMQLNDLREYCKKRNLAIYKEYIDKGISGSKESRPQLNELMKDARSRAIDLVLVWKFDRFARSTTHLINSLNEFNILGLDFVSFTENIQTDTPIGKFTYTIFSAVGEFERTLIQERVKAGIKSAQDRGVKFGRKMICLNRTRIAELKAEGKSIRFIAKDQNCSPGTIHSILHNRR